MKRAVDFDGTLATYEKWEGPEVVGEPIEPMVERVRDWLSNGDEVVILTARVYHDDDGKHTLENAEISRAAIQQWCVEQFGVELEVTCVKDPEMDEIWDDRAIHVEKNTGIIEGPMPVEHAEVATYDMLEKMEW